MLIGTDASIACCRNSGYVVIDIKGLMSKGKLNRSTSYRVGPWKKHSLVQ